MMKTELIRIYDPAEDAEGVLRAGDILAHGGLVAIPTETVYGLAANAYDEAAVKAVYAAKGRPSDNPMIVHIAELSALPELVTAIPENAKILAEAFWPGPLTMVLPRSSKIGYKDDYEFCVNLAEKVGVGAVPGSSFFREDVNQYIRFHFAKKDDTLNAALERLADIRKILKK